MDADEGRPVTIIDLRHALDSVTDPRLIPGAIRMLPDELTSRAATLPILKFLFGQSLAKIESAPFVEQGQPQSIHGRTYDVMLSRKSATNIF